MCEIGGVGRNNSSIWSIEIGMNHMFSRLHLTRTLLEYIYINTVCQSNFHSEIWILKFWNCLWISSFVTRTSYTSPPLATHHLIIEGHVTYPLLLPHPTLLWKDMLHIPTYCATQPYYGRTCYISPHNYQRTCPMSPPPAIHTWVNAVHRAYIFGSVSNLKL